MLPSRNLVRIATRDLEAAARVIRYVPNGIDLARFATDGAQRGAGEPVIGTVAALREEKNIARLCSRAFALLPSGRLVIVGDGPERPALEALAASLGVADRVEFAGHHQDTPAFYARFDIFALSSDTEQMPLSVIEAMASGLPVVATDGGRCVADGGARERAVHRPAGRRGAGRGAGRADRRPGLRRRIGQRQPGEGAARLRPGRDVRRPWRAVAWLASGVSAGRRFRRAGRALARSGAAVGRLVLPKLDLGRLPGGGTVPRRRCWWRQPKRAAPSPLACSTASGAGSACPRCIWRETGSADLDCPYVEQNGILTEAGREAELTALCLRSLARRTGDVVLSGVGEPAFAAARRAAPWS